MSKLVLGKGLGALIPTDEGAAPQAEQFKMVSIDEVTPNPMQPRHDFDPERLAELVASLKQNGMMQPLVVRKGDTGFTIIAGERRHRAAVMAGLQEIPVVVMEAADDVRMLELALVENIQRENLNPLELASAYRKLIDQCGLTQNDLATQLGKSRTAVTNTLRLLTLPPAIQQMIRAGQLTEGHARAILGLPNEAAMTEMAQRIVEGSLSVRQAEQESTRTRRRKLVPKRKLPALSEVETYLKRLLGTSVKIVPGLKRGRIEIEYYGDDDLDRLFELFKKIEG
ncbi:MAG: ParB/RepB/Spo0J family partition protein [Candidatus Zixiibacteriota bacterium]